MAELTVRPTRKRVIAGYVLCAVAAFAWLGVYARYLDDKPQWLAALGFLLLLLPLWSDVQTRFERMELEAGKLRYSSGMGRLSTRTLDVTKVRDVQVDQGIFQRMLGIGDLAVETIGDNGRIVMRSIDRPAAVADAILDACRKYKINPLQNLDPSLDKPTA